MQGDGKTLVDVIFVFYHLIRVEVLLKLTYIQGSSYAF